MNSNDIINVLHLRDSPWIDGPGRTILETASLVDRSKINYVIGAFAGSDGNSSALVDAAASRGLPVFAIKEKKSFDLEAMNQILKYIDDHNIHILHTHETRSDLLGLLCAKKKKIRLVTTLHGWIRNNLKSKILTQIDIFSLHFFDMIIVVSEKLKNQLLRYRIPERKIFVLRNAILPDHHIPDSSDQSFKSDFQIAPETALIGNIGRLSPEKGQEDFLKSAIDICRRGHNVKFILVGIGPDQKKLEKLVNEHSLSDAILFAGFRKDMKRVYNSLDLVVQSSYTEGMPNVILECALMQIPVIATDVGGTSEIVLDGQTGSLIPPGNINLLTLKIEEFIKNPSLYENMTIAAKNHVIKNFDFNWRTQKICSFYIELMQQNH